MCLTRLLGLRGTGSSIHNQGGDSLEVQVHIDSSILFVKEHGNFISHISANLKEVQALRHFTCDTIPFTVQSHAIN